MQDGTTRINYIPPFCLTRTIRSGENIGAKSFLPILYHRPTTRASLGLPLANTNGLISIRVDTARPDSAADALYLQQSRFAGVFRREVWGQRGLPDCGNSLYFLVFSHIPTTECYDILASSF